MRVWWTLAIGAAGCATPGPFLCRSDEACKRDGVRGICQPAGRCSFPDDGCASGQRWDESADRGEACVGDDPGEPPRCVERLAAGDGHTCALRFDGTVWCWGLNDRRQLGDGTNAAFQTEPTRVAILDDALQIDAGRDATCAIRPAGAWCWGNNASGNLAREPAGPVDTPEPIELPEDVAVTTIAIAYDHGCALGRDGSVLCWGENRDGQLGDGGTTDHFVPAPVQGLPGPARGLASGESHTCVWMEADGAAFCWGRNDSGQLGGGDGAGNQSSVPLPVGELAGVAEMCAGIRHTCARLDDATLWCWGGNQDGQLGLGDQRNRAEPAQPTPVDDPVQIACGRQHTCARSADLTISCWGLASNGQMGDGDTTSPRTEPVRVPLDVATVDVAPGELHTCALALDGSVRCWGHGVGGKLGDGRNESSLDPVEVLPICE